ncbi:MAG: ATP synthase F1 subunit delta, partial [Thermoguttaceae bacterium]
SATGGNVSQIVEEFHSFDAVLQKEPRLNAVLSSAMISNDEKVALLQKAFQSSSSPLFWNFLNIVAKRGRLDLIRLICAATQTLFDQRMKRFPVIITTAEPLAEETKTSLIQKLRELVGGEPIVRALVDPDVIGGLVVRVGDTVYDASILTQLKNVCQHIIDRSSHEIQRRRDSFSHSEGN